MEEILHFNQGQMIQQANFVFSPVGKSFEKPTEKQVNAIKYPYSCNKLKQIESIFPQNLMNDLICDSLKKIVELQDMIKK